MKQSATGHSCSVIKQWHKMFVPEALTKEEKLGGIYKFDVAHRETESMRE